MTTYNQTILKRDADKNVIQESYHTDMAYRADYGTMGSIYKAYARPGEAEGSLVWQISLSTIDGSNNVTSVKWPQASNSAASSEFIFSWTARASYTYS